MCRPEDYEHLGSGIDWDRFKASVPPPDPMYRQSYLDTADELSADPTFIDHMDPVVREFGEEYARTTGLPWPPYPDVDIAGEAVKAYERSLQGEE